MKGVASAVIAAIIIGTLYVGREVFVPIAPAILLSFVLAPLVRLLQRCRMPRGLAVVARSPCFREHFHARRRHRHASNGACR